MSRDYTGSGRSAANLDNYNKIVYFVGGVMVRNATLDIEETDWSLAAQCSNGHNINGPTSVSYIKHAVIYAQTPILPV
jgi:hypothetical protein